MNAGWLLLCCFLLFILGASYRNCERKIMVHFFWLLLLMRSIFFLYKKINVISNFCFNFFGCFWFIVNFKNIICNVIPDSSDGKQWEGEGCNPTRMPKRKKPLCSLVTNILVILWQIFFEYIPAFVCLWSF